MNADDCVTLFILYCDTKLILYRKALNNASQMVMRYRLLATLICLMNFWSLLVTVF